MLVKKYQEQDWDNTAYEVARNSKKVIVRTSISEVYEQLENHKNSEPKDKRSKQWSRWSDRLKDLIADFKYLQGIRNFVKS